MGNQMPQRPSNLSGFQGSIGSLPLVDLLQVWSANRLSGLVTVTYEGRSGSLYFVDGEIAHAEVDGLTGEPAVQVILGWPEGTFELAPNTATLKRTIQKSLSHLLLDAHRGLDELRATTPVAPMHSAPAAPVKEQSRASVLEQILAIPGVTELVRFGKDGRPVGERGPNSEALAAKGLYLAVTHALNISNAFGLHDLAIASIQGARESFVVVHGHGTYLCIAVTPGAAVDPIIARLRALLTKRAG